MKRKHALRHAHSLARNLNKPAYFWWDWKKENYIACTYPPPRGWAAKWTEVSPSGEVTIFKLREWRKPA